MKSGDFEGLSRVDSLISGLGIRPETKAGSMHSDIQVQGGGAWIPRSVAS